MNEFNRGADDVCTRQTVRTLEEWLWLVRRTFPKPPRPNSLRTGQAEDIQGERQLRVPHE
jgi:hypothetical protein